PPNKIAEALGVERIVRQKIEPLPFHLAAVAAINPPHLQLQQYPRVPAGQIAHPADLAVVPARLHAAATSARRFFEPRRSVITRAFGSPKIARTTGSARKPGNEYESQSRRPRFDPRAIQNSCQIPRLRKCRIPLNPQLSCFFNSKITHSIPRRPLFL